MSPKRRISRREFLRTSSIAAAGLAGLGALGGCAPAPTPSPTVPPGASPVPTPTMAATTAPTPVEQTQVEFWYWLYSPELVEANIARFESQNPDLKVNHNVLDGMAYFDKIIANFQVGLPMDVMYGMDTKRAEYVEAGWLLPIEGMPGLEEVNKDLFPVAKDCMSYKGTQYGLPYFAYAMSAVANEKMLSEAGISELPVTLEELKEACLAIKQAGILEYPLVMNLAKKQSLSYGWYGLAKGSGARFFDDENNPLFPDEDETALHVLEWLVDALNTWQIMDMSSLEQDINTVVPVVKAGQCAFTVILDYDMVGFNDPEESNVVGQIKNYLMPSLTEAGPHGTLGTVMAYFMPSTTQHPDVAWRLLMYLGGKDANGEYYTAKQWTLSSGLGFGVAPLYEDPDIIEVFSANYDLDVKKQQEGLASVTEGNLVTWFTEWEEYHQEQIQLAMLQQQSPRESLQACADKWTELKALHEGA